MVNTTIRGRGAGSPARRSLSAAARAAAKRADRAESAGPRPDEATAVSGRTLRVQDEPAAAEAPTPDPDREAPGPDDPDEAAASGAAAPAGRAPRVRLRTLWLTALAVLLVAGLVALALLVRAHGDGQGAERARVQAAEAARKAAPVVLSYDYRRLDRDFTAARAHLTGSFRDEYRRTTTTVVAPTAKKYRGVVKASVVEPPDGGAPAVSVVSASPERAVVLLFVNQVTTSTQVPGPRVDLNRVRMTLTLTPGGWKVSAVDAL
ncbi:hypothetical protein ACF1G0_19685 [Streptomyces sp. NPDC013953]|uniref:hypothetical protein n=1 Tax=Streptomyces sp. NPDC013953 TaxID=3364868 RepID=UPI0036FB9839